MEHRTRLIIAGSRDFKRFAMLAREVDAFIEEHDLENVEVVSGTCRGADRLGETYAEIRGFPVKRFPADWERFGKKAGPIRNEKMAQYGTHCVVFPRIGHSVGSYNMIEWCVAYELPFKIVRWK